MQHQVEWHSLLRTLVLAAILLAGTEVAYAQEIVEDSEDEFNGARKVRTSTHQIDHEGFSGSARIVYLHVGEAETGSYGMALNVRSRDSWQILGSDTAEFIVDEKRATYDLSRSNTDISGGITSEVYIIASTQGELREIGVAEDVRFRVNGNVYTLTNEAKEAARLIVDRVTGTE